MKSGKCFRNSRLLLLFSIILGLAFSRAFGAYAFAGQSNAVRVTPDTTEVKSGSEVTDILHITANANNKSDELYMHFNTAATDLFDGAFDAYKLASLAGSQVPALYTVDKAGTRYSINTFPFSGIDKTITMAFEMNADISVRLQFSGVESFSDYPGMGIVLTDLKTGNQISLLSATEYTFSHLANDDPNRFTIKFIGITAGVGMPEKAAQKCHIRIVNRDMEIEYANLQGKKGNAQVFDLQGRNILAFNLDGSGGQRVAIPAHAGIYIVKLSFPGCTETYKIILQ